MSEQPSVIGVLLAGGLAKRMGGGDKCLLPLAGKTLLQRTIERAQPQVDPLLLSANGNSLRFARSRLQVIPDVYADNPGPLAGIHAALSWMNHEEPEVEWLASFACDTPFFPTDLVSQLYAATREADTQLAVATSNGRVHPVFALWHASLLPKVAQLLDQGHHPRLQEWVNAQHPAEVDFTSDSLDPFFNINTPQDLYAAEAKLASCK